MKARSHDFMRGDGMGDERHGSQGARGAGRQPSSEAQRASKQAAEECGGHNDSGERLPEIDFSTFVLSLSSSALMHLGITPNAETDTLVKDLPMAKQTIDILGMLQEKTRGNLTNEEDRLLSELLYDLRLKYVSVCQASKQ